MAQTTLPQKPRHGADLQQQIWTVWLMMQYFIGSVYDPFAAYVLGALAGGGSGDKNYTHNQAALSASWAVNHSLGKFPAISVVDTGGNVIDPDILYVDVNNVTVSFAAATSGKVYCN